MTEQSGNGTDQSALDNNEAIAEERRAAYLRAWSNRIAFGWEADEIDAKKSGGEGDKDAGRRPDATGIGRLVDDSGRIATAAIADSLVLIPEDVAKALKKGRLDVWEGLREVLDDGWKLLIPASVFRSIQPEPKGFAGAAKRIRIVPDVRHAPSARRVSEVPVIVEQRVRTYRGGGPGRNRVELKVTWVSRRGVAGGNLRNMYSLSAGGVRVFPNSWTVDVLDRRAHLGIGVGLDGTLDVTYRSAGKQPGPKPLVPLDLAPMRRRAEPRPHVDRWSHRFRRSPVAPDVWIGSHHRDHLVAIARDGGFRPASPAQWAVALLDGGVVSAERDGWGGGKLDGQYVIGPKCVIWFCSKLGLAPPRALSGIDRTLVESEAAHQLAGTGEHLFEASRLLSVSYASELRAAIPNVQAVLALGS